MGIQAHSFSIETFRRILFFKNPEIYGQNIESFVTVFDYEAQTKPKVVIE